MEDKSKELRRKVSSCLK